MNCDISDHEKEVYLKLAGHWTHVKNGWNGYRGVTPWYYKGGAWVTLNEAYEMEITKVYYDGKPYYN